MLRDGLYQVTLPSVTCGFVVKGGRITLCAPYLRKVPRDRWRPKRVITDLILVTGSRRSTDKETIRHTLAGIVTDWSVPADQVGLLHGGAGGADSLCASVGDELGMFVQKMDADWDACTPDCPPGPHRRLHKSGIRTYCPYSGRRRNQAMCDRVVAFLERGNRRVVCAVFRSPGKSTGTDDCVKRATAAGIPLRRPEDYPRRMPTECSQVVTAGTT